MGISLETLALARKYADQVAAAGSQEALQQAVEKAVLESKLYTDEAIRNLTQFQVKIVSRLPITDIDPHTIYFVPMSTSDSATDSYYEYMYIDESWELIGNTQIDLSDYFTKEQVNKLIQDNKYVLPTASTTTLGGVKIDNKTILINTEGMISTNLEVTSATAQEVIDKNFTNISDEEISLLF